MNKYELVLVVNAKIEDDARVATVEDLLLLSYEGLMKVRNMGKKTLIEVEKKLESFGISLDALMRTHE